MPNKSRYYLLLGATANRYPLSEGWEITPQDNHGTYIPDFVIEKQGTKYKHKVVAEVKKCKIVQADVDQLNAYVKNLAGPNVKIQNKILIVASGADTTVVPSDIEIIYLKGFVCK